MREEIIGALRRGEEEERLHLPEGSTLRSLKAPRVLTIGGMPGTSKTRCMALFSILVAGVGKRKVLFTSLQNEQVRSMMVSVEERQLKRSLVSSSNSFEYPG